MSGKPVLKITEAAKKPERVHIQWNSPDGSLFYPSGATRLELPPGMYHAEHTQKGLALELNHSYSSDDIVILNNTQADRAVTEINKFWNSEELYRGYGLTHKRGVLLYGPPGTGKTYICRMIITEVLKKGGVAIKYKDDAHALTKGLKFFREVQPDTPVVVLLEDIDAILKEEYQESEVLNLLDGVDSIDKAVYLATTNYPEQLEERIVNRPSRFDLQLEVGPLSAANRRLFLISLTQKANTKLKPSLSQWVKDTKGMAISHIKELFIGVQILGSGYDERLKALKELPTKVDPKHKQKAGFNKVIQEPEPAPRPRRRR